MFQRWKGRNVKILCVTLYPLSYLYIFFFFHGWEMAAIIISGMWWRLRIWGISFLFTSFVPFGPWLLLKHLHVKGKKWSTFPSESFLFPGLFWSFWVIVTKRVFGIHIFKIDFLWGIFQTFVMCIIYLEKHINCNDILF